MNSTRKTSKLKSRKSMAFRAKLDLLALLKIFLVLLALGAFLPDALRAEDSPSNTALKIGPILKNELSQLHGKNNLQLRTFGANTDETQNSELETTTIKVIVVVDADHLQPLPDELLEELTEEVKALGGRVGNHAFNNVQVWIPAGQVEQLADLPLVKLVKKPTKLKSNNIDPGTLNVIGARNWQNSRFTGKGVKVGIIDIGFKGYSSLLGRELPQHVTAAYTGSVSDFNSTAHGTACAEIIHDIAPDAELFFVNVADREVSFLQAVSWLRAQGVDVISSSMGLDLKLYTSMLYLMLRGGNVDYAYAKAVMENLDQAEEQMNYVVSSVVQSGTIWSQSAGNEGQKRWSGWYYDKDGNDLHNFSTNRNANKIDTRGVINKSVEIVLMWGSNSNLHTYDDYDMFIVDQYGHVVDSSLMNQSKTPLGMEACQIVPQIGREYYIVVRNFRANAQNLIILVGDEKFANLEYNNPRKTVLFTCPASNPDVITVGAVHPSSSSVTIAPYSSQGPGAGGVMKPDIVAPAGVRTVSYGARLFYGTSAAAPHVAGISALVKQKYPTWNPVQVKNYLVANALDLGAPGTDTVYGSGLVQLPEMSPSVEDPFVIDTTNGVMPLNRLYYWGYPATANPVIQSSPAGCKPISVGSLAAGVLDLQIGLPVFSTKVDVYVALEVSGTLYMVDDNGRLYLASGLMLLPKWKSMVSEAVKESLNGIADTSWMPAGNHNVYLAVVPSGETDFRNCYIWSTSFAVSD